MLSWLNDKRCGQWLLFNVPFQSITDFLDVEIDEKVPSTMRYNNAGAGDRQLHG